MARTSDEDCGSGMTRRRILSVLGYGGVALVSGSVAAAAAGSQECAVITGTQEDSLFADGCTSPVGFCARGCVQGQSRVPGNHFVQRPGV